MSVLSLQLPQGSRGAMWRAALLPGVGLASCLAPTLIAHHSASSHAPSSCSFCVLIYCSQVRLQTL